MKIIGKDNIDREERSDILVCENINKMYGDVVVRNLNELALEYYYSLVPDNYKLYVFNPT
jgi:hypothetical protein